MAVLLFRVELVGKLLLFASGNLHDEQRNSVFITSGGALQKTSGADNGLMRRMGMSEKHGLESHPKQYHDVHTHGFPSEEPPDTDEYQAPDVPSGEEDDDPKSMDTSSEELLQKDDVPDPPPPADGDNPKDSADIDEQESKKDTAIAENEVDKENDADPEGSNENQQNQDEPEDPPKGDSEKEEVQEEQEEEREDHGGNVKPGELDPGSDPNHDMQPDDPTSSSQVQDGTSLSQNQGSEDVDGNSGDVTQSSLSQKDDPSDPPDGELERTKGDPSDLPDAGKKVSKGGEASDGDPAIDEDPSRDQSEKEGEDEEREESGGNVKSGELEPGSDPNHDMQPDSHVEHSTSLSENQGNMDADVDLADNLTSKPP